VIERAQFAPVQCRYKVYVIDECHMLSAAAFNALLKTLEEPPARVVFVLATTDPQRVLPTIISRCQRFDFRRIALEPMVEHLQQIATQENINIAADAVQLVAQIAQGGLRDAESLLDQLSLLPDQITREQVWDLVGAVPERDLMVLLGAIAANSPEAVLEQARYLMDRGREPLIVLQNLAGFYRDLLIAKTAPQRQDLVGMTPATWAALCDLAQELDISTIFAGQQHLRACEGQIKHTTQPRLWLEVTLLGLLPSSTNLSPSQTGSFIAASRAITPASRHFSATANGNQELTTSVNAPASPARLPQTPSGTTSPAGTIAERLKDKHGDTSNSPLEIAPYLDTQSQPAIPTPTAVTGDILPALAAAPTEAKQTDPMTPSSSRVEATSQPPANVTLGTSPADVKQPNPSASHSGVLQESANDSVANGQPLALESPRTAISPEREVLSSTSQAELDQTWQQLLAHLHPLSRALLKEHGKLLMFRNQEAKIGITSQNLVKIAQSRVTDIETTFIKLFDLKVRVSLQVVPAAVEAPPTQSTTRDHHSPAYSNDSKDLAAATVAPQPDNHWRTVSPTGKNHPQASQAAVSLIPEAVVEVLQDKSPPPAPETKSPGGDSDFRTPNWQEDEVLRAAKSLAQFFNGEIVTQEAQTSENSALESTQSQSYNLPQSLMNTSDESDTDESDDLPF